MPSTNQEEANVNISPVLFMSVDGESLSFFLRPGPIKRRLQPLITAGGGTLCNMQRPGAILLMDPEEIGSINTTTAHWFVSTQYIHDCIKKSEQLNIEDYRLNPDVIPKQSPKHYSNKGSPAGTFSGRVAYTAEEDAAILSYVSKHESEAGGNRLWQDMEKKRVTNHSWQSMKYRYRVRLTKKQPEVAEVTAADEAPQAAVEEMTVEENHEAEEENPSSAEHAASPQNHSAEADVTQMDTRDNPVEDMQLDDGEAQTSICTQGEEQHANPQTDIQPDTSAELKPVEAETSDTLQPGLEPPADTQPSPAENAEPETEEPQTVMSPQKESTSKDLEPPEPKSQTSTLSQKKPEEKQKNSPQRPQRPQRPATRRKPEESLPQPYAKKLRSSRRSPSPLPPKKVARKSAAPKDVTDNQLSPKKAKGSSVEAVVESQPEESSPAPVCEAAAAESISKPQMGEKRKEKRKLGILEMATKEFEDESESDEDQAPDLQNLTQSVTKSPTATKDLLPTPAVAASTQSRSPPSAAEAAPAPAPSRAHLFIFDSESQEDSQSVVGVSAAAPDDQHKDKAAASLTNQSEDGETPDLSNPAETVTIQPASTDPEPGPSLRRNVPETPAGAEAITAPSRPHHFIFDSESQEDSQSILGAGSAAPADQHKHKAAASLTQDQLEEDKQRIRALMKETKQDLVSVTKALLKTSGDFSDALDLLLNPDSFSGLFWDRSDDPLLLSGDAAVRQQLQDKYSEDLVAKRLIFLGQER